jgi:hypothetical protein
MVGGGRRCDGRDAGLTTTPLTLDGPRKEGGGGGRGDVRGEREGGHVACPSSACSAGGEGGGEGGGDSSEGGGEGGGEGSEGGGEGGDGRKGCTHSPSASRTSRIAAPTGVRVAIDGTAAAAPLSGAAEHPPSGTPMGTVMGALMGASCEPAASCGAQPACRLRSCSCNECICASSCALAFMSSLTCCACSASSRTSAPSSRGR